MKNKKYYVYYYESKWDSPKKCEIFTDFRDFIDFVQISCINRDYEIYNIEIKEEGENEKIKKN